MVVIMRRFSTVLFFILCGVAHANESDIATMFDEYPASDIYTGKHHPPVLTTIRDHAYNDTLEAAARKAKVDFGGHYIIAGYACGSPCLSDAVIDAITGKVIWFPIPYLGVADPNWNEPFSYCRNSRMLLIKGIDLRTDENAEWYYELKDDQFVLIKKIKITGPIIHPSPEPDAPWQNHYVTNPAYCHPASEARHF